MKKRSITTGDSLHRESYVPRNSNKVPQNSRDENGTEGSHDLPLEKRMINSDELTGPVQKLPALHKKNAHNFGHIQFYLPTVDEMECDDGIALVEWSEAMEVYYKDLIWLLELPYHKFWSFLAHASNIADPFLSSYLLRSVKPYDPNYAQYVQNQQISGILSDIHKLVFRIYLRISVYKESKADFLSPGAWSALLLEHNILDLPKLLEICSVYSQDTGKNRTLNKMIENVFKNEPRFMIQLKDVVNTFLAKVEEPLRDFGDRIRCMAVKNDPDVDFITDLLAFQVDTVFSLTSFIANHQPSAIVLQDCDHIEIRLAAAYEEIVPLFGSFLNVPKMSKPLSSILAWYRQCTLELFRLVLTAAFKTDTSYNPKDIDRMFDILMLCMENKLFIYDYTKAFSLAEDVSNFNAQGAQIDDTRIDYILNAISECWSHFGDDGFNCTSGNSKKVSPPPVDPLLDPDFDRQLLGACSLEINGIELQSLISEIKDLFSDLPERYIEVLLKHFAFKTEAVINAILENNLPPHLEKYKTEPSEIRQPSVEDSNEEVFHRGKWKTDKSGDVDKSQLKQKIFESLSVAPSGSVQAMTQDSSTETYDPDAYVDSSLLPDYYGQNEYEDEYDDTYDETGMGYVEPGEISVKPLNKKIEQLQLSDEDSDTVEDETSHSKPKFEQFVEDPALVRERQDQRRAEKAQLRKPNQPERSKDLVGKPKGQGQDKDVLLNRRYKTMHSNQQRKRGADQKRKY